MDADSAKRGKTKFEEDIKPPFHKLYSFSTKQTISKKRQLKNLKAPGSLYPDLPKQLDDYKKAEPITQVGKFRARELVISGADFQIGKKPKVEAECALVVWYNAKAGASKPVVAEFSFHYGDDKERYPGKVAQRAYEVFECLKGPALKKWVDPKSKTKTAYVYSLVDVADDAVETALLSR